MSRPRSFKANFRGSVVGGNELKCGMLQKKSTGTVKRWQKRYFTITGHYLKYYHNAPEEAGEDPGDIDAAFDLTQTSNCTYHGRRLDLKLGSHLLELQAISAEDAMDWHEQLSMFVPDRTELSKKSLSFSKSQQFKLNPHVARKNTQERRNLNLEAARGHAQRHFDSLSQFAGTKGWADSHFVSILEPRARPDGLMTTNGHLKNLKEEEDPDKRLQLLLEKVRLVTLLAMRMPKSLEEPLGRSYIRRLLKIREFTVKEVGAYCLENYNRKKGRSDEIDQVFSEVVPMAQAMVFKRDYAVVKPAVVLWFATEEEEEIPALAAEDAGFDPDDEDAVRHFTKREWAQLEVCYDLFDRMVQCKVSKATRLEVCSKTLVVQLLSSFDTPEWKERDRLMGSLHALYSSVNHIRPCVRLEMRNAFLTFIYENNAQRGVAHILSVLASILAGCTQLKPEYIELLHRALIPMHSGPILESYQEQLCLCLVQYLLHDVTLITPIVEGICHYWPQCNHKKALLLIDELQECIMQLMSEDSDASSEHIKVAPVLAKKFVACLRLDSHSLVTKKTLMLLGDLPEVYELLAVLPKEYMKVKMAVKNVADAHWSEEIVEAANTTFDALSKLDEVTRTRAMSGLHGTGKRTTRHQSNRNSSLFGIPACLVEVYDPSFAQAAERESEVLHAISQSPDGQIPDKPLASQSTAEDKENVHVLAHPSHHHMASRASSISEEALPDYLKKEMLYEHQEEDVHHHRSRSRGMSAAFDTSGGGANAQRQAYEEALRHERDGSDDEGS